MARPSDNSVGLNREFFKDDYVIVMIQKPIIRCGQEASRKCKTLLNECVRFTNARESILLAQFYKSATFCFMWSDSLRAMATIVNVGGACPPVEKTELPAT